MAKNKFEFILGQFFMLFVNSLSFRYPTEPVVCYFSSENDEDKRSVVLKSKTLFPKEVGALFAGAGGMDMLYTTYDNPCNGFQPIAVDFNNLENEDFVKRFYNWKLKRVLAKHEELMFTTSGITNDLMVWAYRGKQDIIDYLGQKAKVFTLDRFTLKVRYDTLNKHPYLLIASDRPAQMLDMPLSHLRDVDANDPFSCKEEGLSTYMVNKVVTRIRRPDGTYSFPHIYSLRHLQECNIPYELDKTRPILTRDMKHILDIDSQTGKRDWNSKYVKYMEKITWFKDKYLQSPDIRAVFDGLSSVFSQVSEQQIGQVDSCKRILRFGGLTKSMRPQDGINAGPARNCPNTDVRLIFIFCERDRQSARDLLNYFHNGNYGDAAADESRRKRLSKYMGTTVSYASREFHIIFKDSTDPVPEVLHALQQSLYQSLDPRIKYFGIYVSPIHKHTNDRKSREAYYLIKEALLKRGIPSQCVSIRSMLDTIERDKRDQARNFLYHLQNMGIAICAKTGGAPWLLDEMTRKELIIGIGAFRTDNEQYIGAAFAFDNTGVLCDYNYFQKSEFRELVGAIQAAIIHFSSVNNPPERLIIHYYKKLSMRDEAASIMAMLSKLGLDIPVYVVSINKTESEDVVVFDDQSTYTDRKGTTHQSLMPMSGTWVNLGRVREGYRYLLCNNTRYEDNKFRATDGFPFPVKLTICCFGGGADIDIPTIELLIGQVYQFSRIYWRSVRQQGLPVTIKYPEMIAEILPHFESPTVYPDKDCLWFI